MYILIFFYVEERMCGGIGGIWNWRVLEKSLGWVRFLFLFVWYLFRRFFFFIIVYIYLVGYRFIKVAVSFARNVEFFSVWCFLLKE